MKANRNNFFLILSRLLCRTVVASMVLGAVQAQTTGNWNYNGATAASLSWNTTASWTGLTGSQVPNAIGATTNFTFNITAARTITLDGDKTVGTLAFDDPTSSYFGYTLNAGTPSTSQLIFDVASGSAALNTATAANTANNTINPPIQLNDPLVITTTRTNTGGGLTLAGVISDGSSSYSITKAGNGNVTLSSANEYDGGTIINAGRINASNVASMGTGSVTVNSGGQFLMNAVGTFANDLSIAGDGYTNTNDGGALNGALRYLNATSSGTITLTGDARIGAFNGVTGTIAGPLTQTGGPRNLEINSTVNTSHNGNIVLTGNAEGLTGTVTVSQGTLRLGTNSNLGGSMIVRDGASLYAENIGTAGGATIGVNLTLGNSGSSTTGANFYVDPSSDDALLVTGNLTLNGTNTVILTGPITSSSIKVLTYGGSITGDAANLSLLGGLATYRLGTGFTTTGNEINLNVVSGDVKWTGAATSDWNATDVNWTDGTPTTYYNLDAVTFDDTAATNAVLTTNLANATNNDLVFTAVAAGAAGESISIEYFNPGLPDSALGISVTGNAISVSLATDGIGNAISTAGEIKTALEASVPASALVTVAFAVDNDGSGLVSGLSATPLALANPIVNLASGEIVSPGEMTFNHSAIDYTVSGLGVIAGGCILNKSGSGMLTLSTANTFAGGTSLTNGRLRVGNASALGTGLITMTGGQLSSNSTTAFTLTNGLSMGGAITLGDATDTGALTFSGDSNLTSNTTITIPSGAGILPTINGALTDGAGSFSLTKDGASGVLRISGANTYDGGTFVLAGRLDGGNINSFGSGPVVVSDGAGTFLSASGIYPNNFTIQGDGYSETAGSLGAIRLQTATIGGTITLAADSRITSHGSTGALTGAIGETGGARALELSNYNTTANSTITVSGNNTYSGGTIVKGVILQANSSSALGTGPISIESNGTATRVTRLQLGTDVVIDNDITIPSNAETAFRGAVHSYSGSLTTPSLAIVNGDIEIQGAMGNGGHLAAESGSLSVLRVMGAVNVANPSIAPLIRVGTVELGGGGNYSQLNHAEGTLRIVAANGVNATASLNMGSSGASIFDLNGFNQTLIGLTKGASSATVVNNGATASALTLDMATSSNFGGVFLPGTADINLIKTGVGTLTLSGDSSTALGSLVVNGGGVTVTGTLGSSSFSTSVNMGGVLGGEGTLGGNVAFNGGTLQVNAATSLGLLATGNLNTTGGVSVDITTLPTNSDPIEVITFGGTHTGSVANFTLVNSGAYRNPQFQVNLNNVTLTFGAAVDLTWTGVGGNTWDINTTSNWQDSVPVASKYFIGDNVTFTDVGSGTVQVPATVTPGTMVINSNQPWLFEGAGTIETGSLTKDGTGAVSIATPWLINGPLTLTAGSLQLAVPNAQSLTSVLSGAGTLIKSGSAALTVTQANTGFTGAAVISSGELIMSSTSSLGNNPNLTFGNADTLATDVLRLTLPTTGAITSPVIQVAATSLDARILTTGGTLNNATITKKGTGRLRIGHASTLGTRTSYVTGTSSITIEAGTLAGASEIPFSTTTTVTMGNSNTGTASTVLEIPGNQTSSNDVITMQSPLALSAAAPNSEAIVRYAGGSVGSMSISSAIALNGRDIIFEHTGNITPPNLLYNVTGVISGNGNVRMRGNSGTTIRIQGANTFTGDFYMLSGRVQTAFGGTTGNNIPDTARIIMSPGATFSLSNTGETVRGLVGGAPTESITTPALINQGRGDLNVCRLTVNDSNAMNTHTFHGTLADRVSTSPAGLAVIAFTKAGAATQVLTGVHTYSGTTIVTEGTLEIGGAGQLGSGTYSSAITITSPGILKFNSTANQTLQTGVISSTGDLVKDNTGTLTLTAANTFSGNITVDGGTLIGAGSTNSPGVTVFGSRTNTRVFTITDGGTLQFNSGNILGSGHTATTAPKLVINSGGVVTNGGTATNNALNDIELNGGTLTSTTGHTSSADPFTPVYGAWNLNGAITSTGTSTISTSDATKGWIMLKVAGDKISNFNVVSGTLTVSAPVVDNPTDGNIGALTKSGTGTMVMTGVNTYTGATTVSEGTLALVGGSQASPVTVSAGASLGFTLESPTTSTSTFNLTAGTIKITGTPTLPSYDLITSSAGITGTPVLHTAIPGYQLKVVGSSLKLVQALGYASWAGVNTAGPNLNDDHDNDGVPNGVEYFLGGPNGNTTGFTSLPGVTNTLGTLSVTWVMGSGYAGVYGTDFTVETSETLTGLWNTESSPGTVTISGSNVTYTFPTPLGTKKFARLKVTGP